MLVTGEMKCFIIKLVLRRYEYRTERGATMLVVVVVIAVVGSKWAVHVKRL
jgi:hypothetical protein